MTRATKYNKTKRLANQNNLKSKKSWPQGSTAYWTGAAETAKNVVLSETVTKNDPINEPRNIIKQNKISGKLRVILYQGNTIKTDKIYDIPNVTGKALGNWFDRNMRDDFMHDSDTSVFQHFGNQSNEPMKLVFAKSKLKPRKLTQYFARGYEHCLFTPIKEEYEYRMEHAKTERTKRRYMEKINKVEKYTNKYKKGVPENKIASICKDLGCTIIITDALQNTIIKHGERNDGCTFKFMNTSDNHVNLNKIVSFNDAESATTEQLNKLKQTEQFCVYREHNGRIKSLYTADKHYKHVHDSDDAMKIYDDMFEVHKFSMNATKNPLLTEFVREGVHVAGCVDYKKIKRDEYHKPIQPKNLVHIDQTKSYTQCKLTKYYEGFPTLFTDFRKVNNDYKVLNNVGYYAVKDISFDNCNANVKKHFKNLKTYKKSGVFPSVELKFLKDYGVTFTFVAGAWGVNEIDIDFYGKGYGDELKALLETALDTKDEEGVPCYSKWSGRLGHVSTHKRFHIKCSEELAAHLATSYDNVEYYENEGDCIISVKKEEVRHQSHIFGFITAYSRINLMTQLFKIPASKVVRVVMDGIYFKKCEYELLDTFREKDPQLKMNIGGFFFMHNSLSDMRYIKNLPEYRESHAEELHIGAGGCGKTTYNLRDKGLLDVLFVAQAYRLIEEKGSEYGINTDVVARVLGNCCRNPYVEGQPPATIIFDEITMMSNKDLKTIRKLYPYSKLIFCGDLGKDGTCYQLPPVTVTTKDKKTGKKVKVDRKPFDVSTFEYIKEHTHNYRIKDKKLAKLLKALRSMIEKGYSSKAQITYLKKQGVQTVTKNNMKYRKKDYILCSKREYMNEWTDMYKGKFKKEKYMYTTNTKEYKNGQIVYSDTPLNGAEIRHGFTIHVVQGLTVSKENVYIDTRHHFETQMIYTAMSRVRSLNQVFLIL